MALPHKDPAMNRAQNPKTLTAEAEEDRPNEYRGVQAHD